MAVSMVKTVSFGGSKAGLATVGYKLMATDGNEYQARTTVGVYELSGGSYGCYTSFPDSWYGSIVWDTGEGTPVYAVEEYGMDGLIDGIRGTGFIVDTHSLPQCITALGFSTHADPTSGIKGANDKDLTQVFDNEKGTDNAYIGTPPTVEEIRIEMEGAGTKLTDMHDEAFGKWVLDPVAKTLTLYKADGVTPLQVFNLLDTAGTVPSFIQRTPA